MTIKWEINLLYHTMCQAEGIAIHATWQRYDNIFCFNLYIDIDFPLSN